MLTREEIVELLEDLIVLSEANNLIGDLASGLEPVFKKVYEKGFKDGAGELPF